MRADVVRSIACDHQAVLAFYVRSSKCRSYRLFFLLLLLRPRRTADPRRGSLNKVMGEVAEVPQHAHEDGVRICRFRVDDCVVESDVMPRQSSRRVLERPHIRGQ